MDLPLILGLTSKDSVKGVSLSKELWRGGILSVVQPQKGYRPY
jgi:hypothetical protein